MALTQKEKVICAVLIRLRRSESYLRCKKIKKKKKKIKKHLDGIKQKEKGNLGGSN